MIGKLHKYNYNLFSNVSIYAVIPTLIN